MPRIIYLSGRLSTVTRTVITVVTAMVYAVPAPGAGYEGLRGLLSE